MCGHAAGDRGFDPLGLAKPAEYLQIDVDELDQNAPKNRPGEIIGSFQSRGEQVSAAESLQPYDEVRMNCSLSLSCVVADVDVIPDPFKRPCPP